MGAFRRPDRPWAERYLIDFGSRRGMDGDLVAEGTKREAQEASRGAIAERREDGTEGAWVSADGLADPVDDAGCASCHYRGPNEAAIEGHAERTGVTVTEPCARTTHLARKVR